MPEEGYAPLPLVLDDAAVGLVQLRMTSELGTIVARHRRTSRSPRATVFLHGAAGSWTTWTPMLVMADRLGFPIENPVVLDLPGWGEATLASDENAIGAVCELVKDSLDELGFTEWDLVGHSMGGFIAMHMASIWPQSVLSVGTVSCTGWTVISSISHPWRGLGRLPNFVILWNIMRALAGLGRAGTALVGLLRRLGLLRFAVGPLFRHPLAVPRTVVAALGYEVRPAAFSTAVEIARGYDATSRWSRIECEVRAVQGDRDAFARPSDLDGLGRVLPASLRETIRDCGHFALIERPLEVLVALGFAPIAPPR